MADRSVKTIGWVPDFVLGPSEKSGIDHYSSSLIRCLSTYRGDLRFILFISEQRLKNLPTLPDQVVLVPVRCCFDSGFANLFWYLFLLPGLAKKHHVTYLHLFGGNRRTTRYPRARLIVTVQDIFHFGRPALYDRLAYAWFSLVICAALRRLQHVIAVSLATKRDLVSRLHLPSSRISVIHNGQELDDRSLSPIVLSLEDSQVLQSITAPYLLYVSSLDYPRKNHCRLLKAFEAICQSHPFALDLVFVGPSFSRSHLILDAIASSGVANQVHNLGFVSSELLRALYERALIFVHPSLLEGFGYPLLEAMAMGLPVACSDLPVFREIGGDIPVYFDPADPTAMAAAITSILQGSMPSPGAIEKGVRRARSFSLESSFSKLLAYYKRLP
jgi:glycosyltransferase involved in cell wall biosynthesis